jgi:hypothetical protein
MMNEPKSHPSPTLMSSCPGLFQAKVGANNHVTARYYAVWMVIKPTVASDATGQAF